MFLDDQLPPPPPSPETEERVERPQWRGSDLLLGIALLMGGYVTLVIAFSAVSAAVDIEVLQGEFTYATAVMMIVIQSWIGFSVLILARRRGLSLVDLGFRMPTRTWVMPVAVLACYASLIIYSIAVELVERVTDTDLGGLVEGNPLPTGDYDVMIWVLLGIGVVVVAPVAEELFFRGLVFKALDRMWPTFLAMLVSGIAFSLIHLNVSVLIPFALIGIIFAWAFRHGGSLWTPIGAHAIVNGVSFTLTVAGVAA